MRGRGDTLFHSANKVTYIHIYSRHLPYIYSRLANRTTDLTLRNFHKADVCKIYSFALRQANVGRWGSGGGGWGGGGLVPFRK